MGIRTSLDVVSEDGMLHRENLEAALRKLKALGVSTWAVIHCSKIGCGIDENGNYYEFPSLKLPKGFIKGTVGAGILYAAHQELSMFDALKLGACSASAPLNQPNASEGVSSVEEVLALYDRFGSR